MSSEKVKVLIVDDSVVYRTQVKAVLQALPEFEVIAVASNGRLGIDRMAQTSIDLVILDLEMPEMDGIATLKEMRRLGLKSKVVVFSSHSKRGAEITMEALSLGASDFVTKPDGSSEGNPQDKIKALLVPTLKALFANHFTVAKQEVPTLKPSGSYPAILWDLMKPQIVVIGSSTGGPNALEKIFSQIHGPLNCPIVIAQHMPPIFTATLIERLGKISGIPASEAKDGEELEKNHLYIAPGNYHLRLKSTLGKVTLHLDQGEQINFVRPAVDPLFDTAASIFKDRCLGIVLTGMGSDGKVGAEIIKSRGGAMMIQEPKSCVVFGMPGAVHASGAYDRMGTLEEIASVLQEKVCIGMIQGKKYV